MSFELGIIKEYKFWLGHLKIVEYRFLKLRENEFGLLKIYG